MERPNHIGLRHIALNVYDLNAEEHFFTDLLGFKVEWRPDDDNVYLSSGVDNLALHKVAQKTQAPQAQAHIGILVSTSEEVDEWFSFLNAHSVKMGSQPKDHRDGSRSFYCLDPEANVVQVLFYPPISGRMQKEEQAA